MSGVIYSHGLTLKLENSSTPKPILGPSAAVGIERHGIYVTPMASRDVDFV
jgi:hypothetical protein